MYLEIVVSLLCIIVFIDITVRLVKDKRIKYMVQIMQDQQKEELATLNNKHKLEMTQMTEQWTLGNLRMIEYRNRLYEVLQSSFDINAEVTRFQFIMSQNASDYIPETFSWARFEKSLNSAEFKISNLGSSRIMTDALILSQTETLDEIMIHVRQMIQSSPDDIIPELQRAARECQIEMRRRTEESLDTALSDPDPEPYCDNPRLQKIYTDVDSMIRRKIHHSFSNMLFDTKSVVGLEINMPDEVVNLCIKIAYYRVCSCILSLKSTETLSASD